MPKDTRALNSVAVGPTIIAIRASDGPEMK